MAMKTYYRKLEATPAQLVENGNCAYGCYKKGFNDLNLLDLANIWGKSVPRWFKNFRLKEWQAFQFWYKDYIVFGAIYNAKIIGVSVLSVYNYRTREKFHTLRTTLPWQQKVASGLNGLKSKYKSKSQQLTFTNNLDLNRFDILAENTNFDILLDITAYHITEPLVNVMPLGKNRAMYSHKALMPCSGSFSLSGKTYNVGRNDSLLILDDHKGYYPYKLKYNWATAVWRASDGTFYAFNLTQNQSTDPENYNENCFWVNGLVQLLPPVTFKVDGNRWIIKDTYGNVDIEFSIQSENNLKTNLGIIASDYQAPYGTFSGSLRNAKHNLRLNKVTGLGEIKRYKL